MSASGPKPQGFSRITYLATATRLAFDALREGRLPLSPRRWLVDLRHLRASMREPHAVESRVGALAGHDLSDEARKAALADWHRAALTGFLASGARLSFATEAAPAVSIVLVLYNRAELTLACLRALAQATVAPFEVVLVDNASSDDTAALTDRLDDVTLIRLGQNEGFVHACNRAAGVARGDYLVFLNNDAELLPGSLDRALAAIRASPDVGAVGGRLILPDGRLQEAGSIVWADGSCEGYGRGDDPWKPEFSFARDVDYCSGALLVTPRQLFLDLGGFDERFRPAYYEEVDYCLRLSQAGKRVVYEPGVVAMHHEFASSASRESAVAMQRARQRVFAEKHQDWLRTHQRPRSAGALAARDRRAGGYRVLVIDDRVPNPAAGFGFARSAELVSALVGLGHFVTLYPTAQGSEPWSRVYERVPGTVEVMNGPGPRALKDFLAERRGYYDRIVVSRAHNMKLLRARFGEPSDWCPPARVIYDAEALFALRDAGRRRVAGEAVPEEEASREVELEVALARGVHAVMAVSDLEGQHFTRSGATRVHVASHAVAVAPSPRGFGDRRGILFVGAFHELSPNADSVLWFAEHVLPRLRSRLGVDAPFTVVGQDPPSAIRALHHDGIRVCPAVDDVTPFYDDARVFVAPTRYAAGIPLKVVHAAAAGLPVVATSLLARQLDWLSGRDLIAADTPDDFVTAIASVMTDPERWAAIRAGGLARVMADFSHDRFRQSVAAALE